MISGVRLLLVNPPTAVNYLAKLPPAGLAYIAAYARENGVEVDILDAGNLGLSQEETVSRAVNYAPDVLGISVVSGTHEASVRFGKALKEKLPDLAFVLGGPHVHFMYEEMMKEHDWIDFCARGEGEETTLELVRALESGSDPHSVKGLAYRDADGVKLSPERGFIKDLDALPLPARDLLPMDVYSWYLYGLTQSKALVVTITATRGCPFHCHFCASSYLWRVQRRRSVENVLDEIEHCLSNYDVDILLFPDDLLLLKEDWAIELCKGMIERGYSDYTWACTGRPGGVSAKTLDWLKRAKCNLVMYGLEFGNQRLLDFSSKQTTIAEIKETIAETQKRGILTKGFFMIGYPTETRETIEDTINLARSLKLDFADFNLPKALPGSPLYDYCVERDLLMDTSDEAFTDVSAQMVRLESLTRDELQALYKKALRRTRYSLGSRIRKFRRRIGQKRS